MYICLSTMSLTWFFLKLFYFYLMISFSRFVAQSCADSFFIRSHISPLRIMISATSSRRSQPNWKCNTRVSPETGSDKTDAGPGTHQHIDEPDDGHHDRDCDQ